MPTRVLAIGDFHIPSRARWIPKPLEDDVKREIWDVVLCTGDLTSEDVIDWLKSLSSRVYIVKGNMDYLKLPSTAIVDVEGLRIGVFHGAGIHPRGDVAKLTMRAKQLGVDVLVTGHTHFPQVVYVEDHKLVIINPGSATGAWGGDERATLTPSYAKMLVDNRSLSIEVREFEAGRVKVSSYKFEL